MAARPLHGRNAFPHDLTGEIAEWMNARIAQAPLGRTMTPADMAPLLEGTFTADGLGAHAAWERFVQRVAPNNVALDSERFLAFIPVSPSAAGVWMEAAVGAATFSAESWLEASGAVAAENQTLRWLADLMGLPASAGGCFMSGGSIGNLSALAVAREQCAPEQCAVAVSDTAHASVFNSLRLLGLHDTLVVATGPDGRFTGEALAAALSDRADVGIVIGAGGSTNAGVVDDLAGLADVAHRIGAWLHVDAAYGGAALLLPERRHLFDGIERADSVIVDPHKWLFAPEGSCALLYREPALAAAVHTQHGPYVDILHDGEPLWNPSDYGYQLTRRATGLPLWFALAVHGTVAHEVAVRVGVELAELAAGTLDAVPGVSVVMPPMLGVVLFRREGWGRVEWRAWAERLLADGVAFVAPSTWKGEPVGRLVFMHPRTPPSVIDEIAASLRG
ncbi:MAG: aminotransferase class V-fold PLP-dependent enzyme [Actinobacteria bacterium]|nr:aminotransferase class V-fold PLP-dependent enzyme [Actinomycetota bacterium]